MAKIGRFVLDPTSLYSPDQNAVLVCSEREWLQQVGRTEATCWICGEWLCRWTREWLRYLGEESAVIEEKHFPRPRLQAVLKSVPIPSTWGDREVLAWVELLDIYPPEECVTHLLESKTGPGGSVWSKTPSIEHLAEYLSLEIDPELKPFVDVWVEDLRGRIEEEVLNFYRFSERKNALRAWLGIESGSSPREKFPLEVPSRFLPEFRTKWVTRITQSKGEVIETLDVVRQCGLRHIADVAAGMLLKKSAWLTTPRVQKLSPYLASDVAQQLQSLVPPPVPVPLAANASALEALRWAALSYLPYRKWQTINEPSGSARVAAEEAANTFVEWLIQAYPVLKQDVVGESCLNYGVASDVHALSSRSPVLWVVVDGLGWLDHLELLRKLCERGRFSVVQAPKPKISILPTKTEFAKWSLYSQLLPCHPSWEPDAGRAFPSNTECERYTDAPSRRESLAQDLKLGSRRVYCWDTVLYDSLFHNDTNWKHLVQVAVPNQLASIAAEIEYLVSQHPNQSSVEVVICSDHGQIMGQHEQLLSPPDVPEYGGRMCCGAVDDPRFIKLDAARFGLPQDISVVRGPQCIRAHQMNQSGEAVGVHGGLYPEEVVVGVSIIRVGAVRKPLIVVCSGTGKSGERGVVDVEVVNPNDATVTDGYLYVSEILELSGGVPVQLCVEPFGRATVQVQLRCWPELPVGASDKRIMLSGVLRYKINGTEDAESQITSTSALEVTQLFQSGLDLDDFI
jgi:hypothetical protein